MRSPTWCLTRPSSPKRPARTRRAASPSESRPRSLPVGWLHGALVIAFGTSRPSSSSLRAAGGRRPAVRLYASDTQRGDSELERLTRAAGFDPNRISVDGQSSRLGVGGDLHELVATSLQSGGPPTELGQRASKRSRFGNRDLRRGLRLGHGHPYLQNSVPVRRLDVGLAHS